ncbi:hypothetical protein [Gordonia sp. DT101]|uniref:hypothetical protein n=1 Tax=Gordonia sp. DT101 TaxID=3416545 RepID=UPI003CECD5A4
MPKRQRPVDTKALIYRLGKLGGHLRAGRFNQRQLSYLDAVISHYYDTTKDWTDND